MDIQVRKLEILYEKKQKRGIYTDIKYMWADFLKNNTFLVTL